MDAFNSRCFSPSHTNIFFYWHLRNWGIRFASLGLLPPQKDVFTEAVHDFYQTKDTCCGGTFKSFLSDWRTWTFRNGKLSHQGSQLLPTVFNLFLWEARLVCHPEQTNRNASPNCITFVWFALFWQRGDTKGSTHVNCPGNFAMWFAYRKSQLYSYLWQDNDLTLILSYSV